MRIGRAAGSLAERSRVENQAAEPDPWWSMSSAEKSATPSGQDQEVPPETAEGDEAEVRPTGSLSRAFWAQKQVPNRGRRESGWKANRTTQYHSR